MIKLQAMQQGNHATTEEMNYRNQQRVAIKKLSTNYDLTEQQDKLEKLSKRVCPNRDSDKPIQAFQFSKATNTKLIYFQSRHSRRLKNIDLSSILKRKTWHLTMPISANKQSKIIKRSNINSNTIISMLQSATNAKAHKFLS